MSMAVAPRRKVTEGECAKLRCLLEWGTLANAKRWR